MSRRGVLWAFGAILALAIAVRWLAFSMFDFAHADEVMQYLEQGHRIATGHGLIPWETRYAIRNNLLPDLLAAPMALTALFTDAPWAPLVSARVTFAALCLGAVPAAYALGARESRLHGLAAMFAAAIWAESVLIGVQVFSEGAATAAGCAGTAALLSARDRPRAAFAAGFLLALMVLLRMQYAVYAGALALLVLGRDWNSWRRVIIGALPALLLSALADIMAGVTPFIWFFNNFRMNIIDGRAAWFGTADAGAYLGYMWGRMFPAALPVALAALFSGARYRPVLIAAVLNVLAHSVIGHKEYRFIWLSVFLLVVLAAIGSVHIVDRILQARGAAPRWRPAAMTALLLGWAGLSLASFHLTGGFPSFRGGRHLTQSAIAAAQDPATCGIATPNYERMHIAPVLLPRRVPLYLMPDAVNQGKTPFPRELTEAANAMVITGKGVPPPPFVRLRCRRADGREREACLYVRKDGCRGVEAAWHYSYQGELQNDDM